MRRLESWRKEMCRRPRRPICAFYFAPGGCQHRDLDRRHERSRSFGSWELTQRKYHRRNMWKLAMWSLARAPGHMMRLSRPSMRGNTALAPMYETDIEPEPELIENIIPLGQPCSLLELNDSKCRWPIGDPGSVEFFFWGGMR